jgi:DNA-binding transcriptional ArsR family regulator
MSDDTRFARQRVEAILEDGIKYTLYDIQMLIGARYHTRYSDSSISARLRELRNKYGLDIRRERVEGKSYCRYWLEPSKGQMRLSV